MIEKRIIEICKILQSTFEWAIREHKDSEKALEYADTRGFIQKDFDDFKFGYCYKNIANIFSSQTTINRLLPFYQGVNYKSKEDFVDIVTRDLVKIGILRESKRTEGYYSPLAGRLTIPIFNEDGYIVSFAGRLINESKPNASGKTPPKYINGDTTAAYKKSKQLYGSHQIKAANRKFPFISINEGYLDKVALSRVGLINSVALCGIACSREQLELLFKYTDCLLFNLDGDDAGYNAAIKSAITALPLLEGNRQIRVIFNDKGQDPDAIITSKMFNLEQKYLNEGIEFTEEAVEQLLTQIRTEYMEVLKKSSPLSEVLMRAAKREYPDKKEYQIKELENFALSTPAGGKTREQIINLLIKIQTASIKTETITAATEHAKNASHQLMTLNT